MPQTNSKILAALRGIVDNGGPSVPVPSHQAPTSTIRALSPMEKLREKVLPAGDEPLAQRGVYDAVMGGQPHSQADDMMDAASMSGTMFTPKQVFKGGRVPDVSPARMGELMQKFGGKAEPLPMDEASRMARAADQGFTHDMYHGTIYPNKSEFRDPIRTASYGEGDFGAHVTPSPETAGRFTGVYQDLSKEYPMDPVERDIAFTPGGQIMPLKVRMDRTFHVPRDVGIWRDPSSWAQKFEHSGDYMMGNTNDAETMQEIADLLPNYTSDVARRADPTGVNRSHDWQVDLKALMDRKGYDSMSYPNTTEGKGELSYAILDPRKIRSRFAAFDPAKTNSRNLLASLVAAMGLAKSHEPEE